MTRDELRTIVLARLRLSLSVGQLKRAEGYIDSALEIYRERDSKPGVAPYIFNHLSVQWLERVVRQKLDRLEYT